MKHGPEKKLYPDLFIFPFQCFLEVRDLPNIVRLLPARLLGFLSPGHHGKQRKTDGQIGEY